MKPKRLFLLILGFCLAPVFPVRAQDSTIQGLVVDETKAVMPAVQIVITNVATGVMKTVKTNEEGLYAALLSAPAIYNIEASVAGFSAVKHERLKLDVGQTARVDFTMKVGSFSEVLEVSAAASRIDAETSVVGQVIDNRRIVELPLNGRNYLELARLTTAVAPSAGSRPDSKGSFSALGQHGYQTNILLDGIDNNSRASGGQLGFEAQAVTPSIDAVAEFKVVTNNNSAEYGFRMGGTVIVSTKGGSNNLHGSLFEFLRNDKLDGANFFSVGQPKPALRRNQFGGAIGGPIIRKRTFFFGSYEGTRLRLGESSLTTVPTQAMREGDFRSTRPIYDPMTTRPGAGGNMVRDRFSGNLIPADRFDPVALQVIRLYPLPNLAGTVNNHFFSGTLEDDTDQIDGRIDHHFSERHRLFGRYSRRAYDSIDPGPLPLPSDGGLWTTTTLQAHSVVLNLNSTVSAALNNEFRFGYSKINSLLDVPGEANLNEKLGIKGLPDLGDDNQRGMARFTPTGYAEVGTRSFWPNRNNLRLWQFSDNLSQVRGRHVMKTGFEFRRENLFRRAARFARGQFAFNGSFTQDPLSRGNTGDGMADFLLGLAGGATMGNQNGETAVARNYSAYFQDDWRLNSRLTLNLGVRWDMFGPPSFRDSSVSRLVIEAGPDFNTFLRPKDENDCGCKKDLNNFAPRVGFALQLTPKTVLRSGFGMFYGQPDSIAHDGDARFYHQPPDFTEISFPTDRLVQPSAVVSVGFPPGLLPTTVIQPNVLVRAAYRFLPSQYAQQWFADIQRELPFQTVLTFSYIGASTHHLVQTLDANQPLTPGPGSVQSRRPRPQYGTISLRDPLGNASYQAFTAKLEKRYTQGLSFLSSYTWSHSIDDVLETLNQTAGQGLQDNYNISRNRGNSVFDRRHQYVASSVYDLPFGQKRKWTLQGLMAWLFGGWQMGGIVTLRTGPPFTPLISTDISNTGNTNHPDRIGNGTLPGSQRSIQRWFDTAAFAIPRDFTYGNSGRDILFGPGFKNLDLKIGKNFLFGEGKRVEFRSEMFNFTNTPNFDIPNLNVNLPQGGRITSAASPRQIQFGLKFVY